MIPALARHTKSHIVDRGWRDGTDLENLVAFYLNRYRCVPSPQVSRCPVGDRIRVEQQYRIGSYRADFAVIAARVVIEADGWYHRSPEGSASDSLRDSWLRADGWIVLRVDDRHGDDVLEHSVMRAVQLVRALGNFAYREGDLR